jgi:7-carboxy-7-deazaguanine synthase
MIGQPCVLVRLEGCNLTCSYCDANLKTPIVEWEVERLADYILATNIPGVLITGGEPLLQLEEVCHLITLLKAHDIVIETNGTMPIGDLVGGFIAMDVKLFEDDHQVAVDNLKYLFKGDCLKFVFWDKASFERAWEFIEDNRSRLESNKPMIVFSPTKVKACFLSEFLKNAADYPNLDIRMQAQLHKVLGVA